MADKSALQGIIWRLVRGSVTTGIGVLVARYLNDPRYIWLAPVILALSKALREKFPGKVEWLPI